jgi:hypothetical protein
VNGVIKLKKLKRQKKFFISPLISKLIITKNFITMDLKTRDINKEKVHYCVSIYDEKVAISFYLYDYK